MAFTFGYNVDDVTFIYFNLSNYLRPRSQQSYTVHRMAITKFANSSFYLTCLWKSYRRLTLVSKRTNKQMITNKFTNIWLEGNKILLRHSCIKFMDSAKIIIRFSFQFIKNLCDYLSTEWFFFGYRRSYL